METNRNIDIRTVEGFGEEWARFNQSTITLDEKKQIFTDYFQIFPWELLQDKEAIGADIGCGSGRWASLVAPKVHHLHAVDASDKALNVARKTLQEMQNVSFHHASVDQLPFDDEFLDFAYSLGVLHHVPNTAGAIKSVAKKLKKGAPFLIYLYYAFDNQPAWYRMIWKLSEVNRAVISKLPHAARHAVCEGIAASVYWPLARTARLMTRLKLPTRSWPLSYYQDKSFYVMRTDSLDRFGTRLEQRFTKAQIQTMLQDAGFKDIRFSERTPYWCAVGIKA